MLFYLLCQKTFSIGIIYLDMYESIWFKLGMMIGSTEGYILILV